MATPSKNKNSLDIPRLYNFDPYTVPLDELKDAIEDLRDKVGFYETQQLAIKKFINSVYGATASSYFIGFNPNVAEAITLQGQHLNHYSERAVNDYFKGPFQKDTELHKKLGIKTEDTYKIDIGAGKLQVLKPLIGPEWEYLNDTESLVVAGDTDSVSGDTLIYVNDDTMTIADAFNTMKYNNNDIVIRLENGNEVIPVSGMTTRTYDPAEKTIVDDQITYIMRHKVRKKKWKLTTSTGKTVICTDDHSLMVMRDDELIKIKPSEINPKTDKIVSMFNTLDTLYEQPEWKDKFTRLG